MLDAIAAVADADALLAAVDELKPSLVLTDIRLPPTHTDEGLVGVCEHPAVHTLPTRHMMATRAKYIRFSLPEGRTGGDRPAGRAPGRDP